MSWKTLGEHDYILINLKVKYKQLGPLHIRLFEPS